MAAELRKTRLFPANQADFDAPALGETRAAFDRIPEHINLSELVRHFVVGPDLRRFLSNHRGASGRLDWALRWLWVGYFAVSRMWLSHLMTFQPGQLYLWSIGIRSSWLSSKHHVSQPVQPARASWVDQRDLGVSCLKTSQVLAANKDLPTLARSHVSRHMDHAG